LPHDVTSGETFTEIFQVLIYHTSADLSNIRLHISMPFMPESAYGCFSKNPKDIVVQSHFGACYPGIRSTASEGQALVSWKMLKKNRNIRYIQNFSGILI
jgi:hypothetical protein